MVKMMASPGANFMIRPEVRSMRRKMVGRLWDLNQLIFLRGLCFFLILVPPSLWFPGNLHGKPTKALVYLQQLQGCLVSYNDNNQVPPLAFQFFASDLLIYSPKP